MEILGDTLEEIAGEKAGIVKPGIPCLVGMLAPQALAVIKGICRERKAPLVQLKRRDFSVDERTSRLDFSSNGLSIRNLHPSLPGPHQLRNSALVLKGIEQLRKRGFHIPARAVIKGLKETNWPGRFQVLTNGSKIPQVILDVCHNASGARAFAEAFASRYPGRRCLMVVGFVKRKQHQEMVDAFAPIARHVQIVPLKTKRSTPAAELMNGLDWHDLSVGKSAQLETGYRKVLKLARADDTICVIGSHYLVGEFLLKFGRDFQKHSRS